MADKSVFKLEGHPYIALYQLLKVEGWCESGARAKRQIELGLVSVDGKIERRKRYKVLAQQRVCYAGYQVVVLN